MSLAVIDNAGPVEDRSPLNEEEQRDLARCREVLARTVDAMHEAGAALHEVKVKRLYREQYGSFQAFVALEFHMSRRAAYDAISIFEVNQELSHNGTLPPPPNNAVSRELALVRAEPGGVTEAWKETVAEHGPRATKAQTRTVVDRLRRRSARRRSVRAARPSTPSLREADETDRAIFQRVLDTDGEAAARERAADMDCIYPDDLAPSDPPSGLDGPKGAAEAAAFDQAGPMPSPEAAVRDFLHGWGGEDWPTNEDFFHALPEGLQCDDMDSDAPGAILVGQASPILEAVGNLGICADGDFHYLPDAARALDQLPGVLSADQPCVQRWIRQMRTHVAGAQDVLTGLLAATGQEGDA